MTCLRVLAVSARCSGFTAADADMWQQRMRDMGRPVKIVYVRTLPAL